MEDEQQHIVEDEPLKVLELFPRRVPNNIDFGLLSFRKLYDHLNCTICNMLLKTPVFLKCSHRFCKDCIEKHIRTSVKKTCPHCRGELTTKRDLRHDVSSQALIKYLFKDPRLFSNSIEQLPLTLRSSRSYEARKLESQNELKLRREPSQAEIVPSVIKRVRTADPEETKKKKRLTSQKKLERQLSMDPQKEFTPAKRITKRAAEQRQAKRNESQSESAILNTSKVELPVAETIFRTELNSGEKAKKKKIPIIDLASESEPPEKDVQEIRREDFMPQKEEYNICSINAIPEAEAEFNCSQAASFRDLKSEKKLDKMNIKEEEVADVAPEPMVPEPESMVPEEELPQKSAMEPEPVVAAQQQAKGPQLSQSPVLSPQQPARTSQQHSPPSPSPQVLQAIEILKLQFGPCFPRKLIELTTFPFYCKLTLKKHPSNLFIPELIKGDCRLNLRTPLKGIATMISSIFNLSSQAVSLYVADPSRTDELVLAQPHLQLYEVNEEYWRHWSGIQLIDLSAVLLNGGFQTEPTSSQLQRVLFYSISPQKSTQ